MNRNLIRILALLAIPGLLSDRVVAPAFSDVLLPAWQMGVKPLRPSQDALAGLPMVDTRKGFKPNYFAPGGSIWRRWWDSEKAKWGLGGSFKSYKDETLGALRASARGIFLAADEGSRAVSPVSPSQHVTRRPSLNAWIANFNPSAADKALKTYTHHLNELSIFGSGAYMDGRLAPETEFIRKATAAAKRLPSPPRVVLTVANIRPHGTHDNWLIRHWLGGHDKIDAHIQDLLRVSRSVDGLDIDYENMTRDDGPRYTEFVVKLGQEMHARGKTLTVTMEHDTFLNGRIHWKRILPHVDRVRIMAYHYHYDKTGPGAVSPPEIVTALARKALGIVPAEKLEIALPVYGYDWVKPGQARLVATVNDYRRLAKLPSAWAYRDTKTQCARIDYFTDEMQDGQKHLVRHQVWFEDSVSVAHKIGLLERLGVVHIGLWQLGAGDISELFQKVKFR